MLLEGVLNLNIDNIKVMWVGLSRYQNRCCL